MILFLQHFLKFFDSILHSTTHLHKDVGLLLRNPAFLYVKHLLLFLQQDWNNLDALLYQTKSTISNDDIKNKLENSEIETINTIISKTEKWMEDEHTKEEYDNKLKGISEEMNPIMMKVHSDSGNPGGAGFAPGGGETPSEPGPDVPQGPTIDEVD